MSDQRTGIRAVQIRDCASLHPGVGRTVRNGLNFTERGFGVRAAVGCSDRGHSAASQLRPRDIDWDALFRGEGARWFHCGGIFAGLSEAAAQVAAEAMAAARAAGVTVSYDLNYRPSLWRGIGGADQAVEVNRLLAGLVDVMFGNEEDFCAALGYDVAGQDSSYAVLDAAAYGAMLRRVADDFPNLQVIATSLRTVRSASRNEWTGVCFADDRLHESPLRREIEVLDRVGGGDSFAAGLIYGLLTGMPVVRALDYGVAHGALAVTTPGDSSMATLAEVEALAAGAGPRARR